MSDLGRSRSSDYAETTQLTLIYRLALVRASDNWYSMFYGRSKSTYIFGLFGFWNFMNFLFWLAFVRCPINCFILVVFYFSVVNHKFASGWCSGELVCCLAMQPHMIGRLTPTVVRPVPFVESVPRGGDAHRWSESCVIVQENRWQLGAPEQYEFPYVAGWKTPFFLKCRS